MNIFFMAPFLDFDSEFHGQGNTTLVDHRSACEGDSRPEICRPPGWRERLVNFHLVNQIGYSSDTLAAIDAELAFIK
jgi:hypothetical protein